MKTVFKYILVLPVVLLFASYGCTKWVDEIKPETSQDILSLRSSTRDLETIINGAYTGIFAPAGMGQFITNVEMPSDFFWINPVNRSATISTEEYNLYTHNYSTIPSTPARYMLQWNGFTIYEMNFVKQSIEQGYLDKDPTLVIQKDRMIGEALAMRALSYWQQALLYGPQYHSSTLNSLAVVWRDWPILGLVDIPAKRLTVGQMYNLITKDLLLAIPLLPEAYDPLIHPTAFRGRIRKDFAVATLAKVYFQMNNLDSALLQVNVLLGPLSATGSTKYPLEPDVRNIYNKVSAAPFIDWGWKSTDGSRCKEVIYGIDGVSAFRMTRSDKWGFMNITSPVGTPGLTAASERFAMGKPFVDLMAKGDTLVDKRWLLLTKRVRNNVWQNKMVVSALYYPIYRAAEFHLMRAEINARKNNLPDALTDLNVVRLRVGLTAFSSASQNVIIQEIIDERGREMFCEANRYFDMLRLSALSNGTFLVPLGQRLADDKVIVSGADALKFDSPFFVHTFPASEAEYNPGL